MGLKWSLYGDSLYKKESVGRLIQHQRCGVSGLGFHEPGDMILLTGKSEVIRSTSAGNGFIQVQRSTGLCMACYKEGMSGVFQAKN